ncbi:MAG TPA: GNAT family N-acetyltransferase [Candidatus Saccharimonadales bacterium]|nr:GNAT family N-acetyltransferase [Candidatus Saccharimonadales bacterium]
MNKTLGIATSHPEVYLRPLTIPDDIVLSEARNGDLHPLRLNMPDVPDRAELTWRDVLARNPAIAVMGVWGNGELAGEAYTIPTTRHPGWVEIGFQILRDYRRRGYAAAAAGALASMAHAVPDTEVVWAKAAETNIASRKVLQSAGFEHMGSVSGLAETFIFKRQVTQTGDSAFMW